MDIFTCKDNSIRYEKSIVKIKILYHLILSINQFQEALKYLFDIVILLKTFFLT